jgi:alpha-tubulin suppressor-like RCC1 family protein
MKKTLAILVASLGLISLTPGQTTVSSTPTDVTDQSAQSTETILGYQIGEQDGNSRVWRQIVQTTDAQGNITFQTNQAYVELATGLNHLVNGHWVESKEEIDVLPDGSGAVATNGQHQVYFPADIYQGKIKMVTPEGKILSSRPVGLSYDDGSHTVLIAELTNSIGELVGSNQVIYPDAFIGFKADLLYTYTKAGFEQDIILREQPPAPEDFNLASQNCRLQLLTEFFDPPQPTVTTTQLPAQANMALNDDKLDFGIMQMMPGKAFLLGADAHDGGVLVAKEWVNVNGQQILVEEVPVMALADELLELPLPQTTTTKVSPHSPLYVVSAQRLLPTQRLATAKHPMQMAQAAPSLHGLVLDYTTLNTSLTNYTFQGDTTYYISGTVNLYGTNTFEGGAVIKYTNNADLYSGSTINWLGSAYRPIIFTAKDDNTVGDTISGSTGNPSGYYANPALYLLDSPTLSYFRIAYAKAAIVSGQNSLNLYHGQIVNCQVGINGYDFADGVYNVLFANVATNFNFQSGSVTVQNSTFNNSVYLATLTGSGCSLEFTNCIFANLTNLYSGTPTTFTGGYNGFYNSPTFGSSQVSSSSNPFQTVGAGNYYLTNGCSFYTAGTTNVNATLLAAIEQKTACPPLVYSNMTFSTNLTLGLNPQTPRDTNATPDLGYHYDPIDYLVSNVTISATVILTNGVALGLMGSTSLTLQTNCNLFSQGTPLNLNQLVDYANVQEQPLNLGSGTLAQSGLGTNIIARFRFTDFSMPAGSASQEFYTAFNYEPQLSFQDCTLHCFSFVWVDSSGPANLTCTNNLFDRCTWGFSGPSMFATFYNNLFRGGTFRLVPSGTLPWYAQDNLFDQVNLSGSSTGTNVIICSYNGFTLGTTNYLGGSNNITNLLEDYQTGPLGNYYYPTNGTNLATLINAGSTNASALDLYHYTIRTNELVEGTNTVSIGFHYMALGINGLPLDTDGDGIPDYLEDANGDGIYDSGDSSSWTDYYNGKLPLLTILGGNNQKDLTNRFLPLPLTVYVTATNGVALTNAPLTFTVTQGGGLIASSNNGTVTNVIQLRTGISGQAAVWLQLPSTNGTNVITVTAQSGTNVVQTNFTEIAGPIPMMAIGGERIMELTASGDVVSWGGNQYGEFGDYTHLNSTNPVHVVALTNITSIASGMNHSLALDSNGALWAWGQDNRGQLGNGSSNTNLPIQVLGMTNVMAVASHGISDGDDGVYGLSSAVKTNGTVWMWGVGDSEDILSFGSSPGQITGVSNVITAAVGSDHALALESNGTVWAWGENYFGQLGNGTTTDSSTPVQVAGLSNIVAICAGDKHNLALASNGVVWAWGYDEDGELGNGVTERDSDVPVMVAELTNIVAIAAGASHSLAINNVGSLWAWGEDNTGQLGDGGSAGSTNHPMQVLGLTNIISIDAGSDTSVALDDNGNLWQWGKVDSSIYNTNFVWGGGSGYPMLSPSYVDFYNGHLPNLTILSGNNQPPQFQLPLVFQVTATNGVALSNAPVSVEVVAGDMELQTTNNGTDYSGLRLMTDTNGKVSVIGYANPNFVNSNCVVRVLAASYAQLREVDFNETLIPMPTISITSPTNGNTYLLGTNQTLTLAVNAQAAPGGSIQEVNYYYQLNGGSVISLASLTNSPYSFIWTNALWWTNAFHGQYTLTAVVVDNNGASFDSNIMFTVALDSNGTGLPDYWQLQYFGHLGLDPNSDPDGNGQSLLYDYQNGINPTDYYDGVLPNLAITGGNNQGGDAGSFLPMPVIVEVTGTNSVILTNAPVVFTVTNGTALLAATTNNAPTNTLTFQTDSNGQASVWVYFPVSSSNSPDSTILASASSVTNSIAVTANEYALLGHWRFDNTNTWIGVRSQLPLLATNVIGIPDWSSNAVRVDTTSTALLNYRVVETNGNVNINCQTGSVLFYFKPDWSSANQGGTGPGCSGRLIEIGNYNPAFTNGWWGLYLSSDGTQLSFGTSTNGGGMVNLSANISWTSNVWYQIALTYSPTGSALLMDGQLLTNGAGVTYYPNANELTNGFRIGSDQNGTNQPKGAFDELETYDRPLNAIGAPLETYWFGIPDYQSNPNGALGVWEMEYFGYIGLNPNSDPDYDGNTLLYDYTNGIDPNVISFSFSVANQYVSTNVVSGVITILGGTPSSIAMLVDSTNFSSATWTNYTSSNVTVNLGSTQGSHNVWIGLRGLPSNAQQTWEETTFVLDINSLSISITNPVNNVSFNASRVNVSGNFRATSLQQITVNNVLAFVNGTNFEALNVPLNAGSNTITAIAQDLNGKSNTVSINVTGTTNSNGSMNDPVDLQATPVAGFAPLQVAFQVQTNIPGTIQQVSYDFNGDDIADLITNSLQSITNTYATNGEYFPVVTIQTTAGRFSSIGGWNAATLNSSNQPLQINVQAALTQTVFTNITDPVDLKFIGTNLYVLSGSTATITEFATNGTIIRSKSGIGTNPSGFDVDTNGNVYVAVTASNQVWKLDPTNSSFVADTNFGIGGVIGLTNGVSGTNNGQFSAPFDVAVSADGSEIAVSDSGNSRIQFFDTNGNYTNSLGSYGNTIGQFHIPKGLTYDSVDNLYIADSGNNRIVLAQDFGVLGVTGTNGTALEQFSGPVNISTDERGVYVADTGNNRIQSFNLLANGVYSFVPSDIRFAVSTNLNQPAAVAAVDNLTNEMFYVADTGNNRVVFYSIAGDNPMPVWTNMTAQLAAGNITGAASYFSVASAAQYQQAFLSVGATNAISAINQIGTLTPVFIKSDTAEYYFTNTIDGQIITFPVEFDKENGVWKISEF